MNQEKMEMMVKILEEDPERAKAIFSMQPKEAAEAFTALGCAVGEAEVAEVGKAIREGAQAANGELEEGELENVAGGAFKHVCYGTFAGVLAVGVAAALVPW